MMLPLRSRGPTSSSTVRVALYRSQYVTGSERGVITQFSDDFVAQRTPHIFELPGPFACQFFAQLDELLVVATVVIAANYADHSRESDPERPRAADTGRPQLLEHG